MDQSHLDRIWNRAALENGGTTPREGDQALAQLLCAHGLVMNGGVQHAVEALSEGELRDAAAGFLFFGLDRVAELLERATLVRAIDDAIFDDEYAAVIPSDSFLFDTFVSVFTRSTNLFAPT